MSSDRLNGIFRFVFVAAVGLVLTSAAPEQVGRAAGNRATSPSGASEQLDRIATSLEKLPQREERDYGCRAGQEDRGSDLCAQWKAADAAGESARWALIALWIGGFGIAIGGGTLIAAWRAAHWAKKAADHTEAGSNAALDAAKETREANRIARQSLVIQGRPWLRIELKASHQIQANQDGNVSAGFDVTVTNTGKIPALNTILRYQINFSDLGHPASVKHMIDSLREQPIDENNQIGNLHPDRPFSHKLKPYSFYVAQGGFPLRPSTRNRRGSLWIAIDVEFEIPGMDGVFHSSLWKFVWNFHSEAILEPGVVLTADAVDLANIPGVIGAWEE